MAGCALVIAALILGGKSHLVRLLYPAGALAAGCGVLLWRRLWRERFRPLS
jgi:hypothetical protein